MKTGSEKPDIEVICGECGSLMRLVEGKKGKFWGCTKWPQCTGSHSAHQKTGLPMGIPADKETKKWRIKAHKVFDKYRRDHRILREISYYSLARAMDIPAEKAHIGMFNIEQCKEVIKLCKRKSLNHI